MFLVNPYSYSTGDPFWSNVVLLTHMDGTDGSTTFVDNSNSAHTLTAVGNAQVDTAQFKFGGASGLFDGTGDRVSTPDSADWSFGTGNFTIEGWVRPASLAATSELLAQRGPTTPNDFWIIRLNTSGTIRVVAVVGGAAVTDRTGTTALSTNTWYHVAIVRNSGSVQIYVEGVGNASGGTNGAGAWPNSGDSLSFAGDSDGANHYNGHEDEWRITKGVARYTSNFTPPSAPFPNF